MKKFNDTLRNLLKNLGLEKGYEARILAQELKNYLSETYGVEYIGKIKVIGRVFLVEVKSPSLRNELLMKKYELLIHLREKSGTDFPDDIKFVGRL
ncbi:MAG: hypothetical protein ABIM43_01655 [candidate division WOR-3 bacterium]